MEITVLIMAGGQGERFWPKSRANLPKQFLNILDKNKTMIQLTVERAEKITNIKNMESLQSNERQIMIEKWANDNSHKYTNRIKIISLLLSKLYPHV